LAGAGVIGGSIGTVDMQFMAVAGTTPGAAPSTTATLTTEAEQRTAESITVPEQYPGPSMEAARRLEDTPNPAGTAAFARMLLAAMTMADKPGVSPHAEARASAAEDSMAAAVDFMAAGAAAAAN